MYKNGTIVLIENESSHWFHRLVFWCIKKVSGKRWTHIGVYLDGLFFEFAHPFGAMFGAKSFVNDDRHKISDPTLIMTDEEIQKGRIFINKHLRENTRYNHWKLILIFPFIYPTRKLWDKIKWVPFQNNYLWGAVCSVGVGEFFDAIGWDILPGRYAETLTPGCFENSIYHK